MEYASCTVYFDGQFWVALVERIRSDGTCLVGRHVFGPEPSNPELILFYQTELHDVALRRGNLETRFKAGRSDSEDGRRLKKSLAIFAATAHGQGKEARAEIRAQERAREAEEYGKKQERKKERKRGK
jgi:hypothetical protein